MGSLERRPAQDRALASPRPHVLAPLALAFAAHAGLLLLGSRLPPVAELFASQPMEHAETSVDVVVDEPPTPSIAPPTLPPPATNGPAQEPSLAVHGATAAARAAPALAVNGGVAHAPGLAPGTGSSAPSLASTEAEPGSTEGNGSRESNPANQFDEPSEGPAFDPGTSVVLSYALQASHAAPTTAPEAAPLDRDVANRALGSTLRSHDKKVGINAPGAGVVASAVSTTVRGMPLPHNAHAVIEVALGPDGKSTSARVVSASAGDATEWAAATKAMQSALSNQVLALGNEVGSKGVIVRVTVTQKHVFPTGTANGIDLKPVCANGFINEIASAADDKPSKTVTSTVPIFEDENGRPCIPVGVSAVADAANIGANIHIEVRSSFEVIVPGQTDMPEEIDPVNTDAPWVERGKAGPRPTLPQKVRKMLRDKEQRK